MCGPGCKMFLLNPSVSPLEYTDRKVFPYLVMLEIQSPISALRFLILYYIWSVRCKRSARFNLFVVDTIIISPDFDIKIFLVYRKVKTICVYVWIGLTIIISFERIFES